jgi:hypothetical protein
MSVVGFAFIASLGLLHIYIGRLRWIEHVPERQWLSFGAGVSIAYVFVDVLPILGAGQAVVAESAGTALEQLKHHVYLVALLGLVAFYSLELLAKRSRAGNLEKAREDCTSPGVFWVHTGAFALYNALLGYLLREAEHHGLMACALLFFALMLHFAVNDNALRSHHKALYDRFGRWLLALAVIGGYLVGTGYMLSEASIALLWAFVAGGLILNVIKDELPQHRETSLSAFLMGLSGYAALLVVVAH